MTIKNLTVLIDYRFKAGDSVPTQKYLRARIKMGETLGTDLTAQWMTDIDMIAKVSLHELASKGLTGTVTFQIDPILQKRGFQSCVYLITDDGKPHRVSQFGFSR